MIKNKKILITGGTGSLGQDLVDYLHKNNQIVVYSRNEERQYLMREKFNRHPNISFIIGDVRDRETLDYALRGCNYAIHAAAMKDLIMCEAQPTQTVLNNIIGSRTFVDAVQASEVERVVAVSTDKAAAPSNVYGCTKYIMEKIFEEAGRYSKKVFCSARFGNMIDSTGSLVTVWRDNPQLDLKITHPEVSRFFFTKREASMTVVEALLNASNGETYIKEMKAARIHDIMAIIKNKEDFEVMGLYPGEKIHEDLLAPAEIHACFYENGYYIIRPGQVNHTPPTIHNTSNANYFSRTELKNMIYGGGK